MTADEVINSAEALLAAIEARGAGRYGQAQERLERAITAHRQWQRDQVANTKRQLSTAAGTQATDKYTPPHYARLAIEPWDAMEAWMPAAEFRGFLRGNVIKYMARTKSRDDIAKAAAYMKRLREFDCLHDGDQHV